MTTDMTHNRKLTWNGAGGLTLAVLFVSSLVGVWMMGQRVFLAPPLAASTFYFYINVDSPMEIIDILTAAGVKPERIILGHEVQRRSADR